MTLETRDQRTPSSLLQLAYSNPNPTEYQYPQVRGTYQQIDSVRTGKFVPGQFRANPVSIKKVSSKSTNQPEPQRMWLKAPWAYAWYEYWGDVPGCYLTRFSDDLVVDGWGDQSKYLFNWSTKHAEIALTKAHAQLNEAKLDVGVMLGELPETLEFLKNPIASLKPAFQELRSILKRVPRNKRSQLMRRSLDSTASTWLSYRYGLKPLVNDLRAIYDLLKDVDERASVVNSNLQRVKRSFISESDIISDAVFQPAYLRYNLTVRKSLIRKSTAHLYYKVTGTLPRLAQFGLDLGSAPSVAWELLRLSFVWDWLINVGDWIKSWNTSFTISMIGSSVSQKMTCATTVVHKTSQVENSDKYVPLPVIGLYGKPSSPTAERITELLIRKVNLARPVSPHVLWAPLSLVRKVDALSLIWQFLPRRLR